MYKQTDTEKYFIVLNNFNIIAKNFNCQRNQQVRCLYDFWGSRLSIVFYPPKRPNLYLFSNSKVFIFLEDSKVPNNLKELVWDNIELFISL